MDASPAQANQARHFKQIVPTTSYWSRLGGAVGARARAILRASAGSLPGLTWLRREGHAQPRLQQLTSDSPMMARWYKQAFGTDDKPDSLHEIPWDYVAANQEDVPFWGLREYWYPALFSSELGHNEHKVVKLLGDNVVVFRDKDGAPAALENRCPHRGALLSLGQVNVWEIGTLTCRYHGMTFDKKGECIAFLADGPDSPACGRIRAKAYPACEVGGIIWLYMGELEPEPLLAAMPHAREVLADGVLIRKRLKVPYSYLNQLDNTVDMTHVGCLHRTCYLFGDQKMGGGVSFEELPGNGVHAKLREGGSHGGTRAIDEIRWFMPNLVHHGEEFMEGGVHGVWFWFVPNDIGEFTGWLIGSVNEKKVGWVKAQAMATVLGRALQSDALPGMACFIGGDAPMQQSQGRVVRWDKEQLARTDRAVLRVRAMMKEAFKREQKIRKEKGLDPLAHRVTVAVKAASGDGLPN